MLSLFNNIVSSSKEVDRDLLKKIVAYVMLLYRNSVENIEEIRENLVQ
jgi:hypothetical protein